MGKETPRRHSCVGCDAREEQLVFLREQVKLLQDRLLSLVPDAADRYHRLQLTQMANMKPSVMDGVVPLRNTVPESEDEAIDQFLNSMMKPVSNGRG